MQKTSIHSKMAALADYGILQADVMALTALTAQFHGIKTAPRTAVAVPFILCARWNEFSGGLFIFPQLNKCHGCETFWPPGRPISET